MQVDVGMARQGKIPEIGGGDVHTNPIADDDLARICADAISSTAPALEVDCGGPEVMTRRAIAEAAFAAIGQPPRIRSLPALPVRMAMTLARPLHPRISQFFKFIVAISTQDLVAPAHGQRRLADAFAAVA